MYRESAMKKTLAILAAAACIALGVDGKAAAAVAANLDNVIVYPSPFDVRKSHTVITFSNLTATATLRIYTLSGETVFEGNVVTVDGRVDWDVTNNDHKPVASGLYLYVITNTDGQKKTGKIAVLR